MLCEETMNQPKPITEWQMNTLLTEDDTVSFEAYFNFFRDYFSLDT